MLYKKRTSAGSRCLRFYKIHTQRIVLLTSSSSSETEVETMFVRVILLLLLDLGSGEEQPEHPANSTLSPDHI